MVIPTYNGANFLQETLGSVLAQSFTDFEVVVSDDGSTDETLEIVAECRDSRIRVADDRSHIGPAGNWNRALRQAGGEYVKILAQDDLLYPDILGVQVNTLDRHPRASFAAVKRDIIGSDGSVLLRGRGLSGLCGEADLVTASRQIVRSGANQCGEGAAVLLRREATVGAGGFDGSLPYAIDIDYWMRLLNWGPMVGICDPHAAFRVSSQSWSNSLIREQGQQFTSLIDRLAADPRRGIPPRDVKIGRVRARLNAAARQAFYLRHRSHL